MANGTLRLALDFGNTTLKAFLFENDLLIDHTLLPEATIEALDTFINGRSVTSAILGSVVHHPETFETELRKRMPLLHLDHTTPLPVRNGYGTPDTLGYDRLAAAIGARQLFPDRPVLAITAGTCIIYDLVDAENVYRGGAIAPGLRMRFKALHAFTQKLPQAEPTNDTPLTGDSTLASIRSGVQHGASSEIDGMIQQYAQQFPGLQAVLSGGDAVFFEKALKNRIFARPNLVAEGLNHILAYNLANHSFLINA